MGKRRKRSEAAVDVACNGAGHGDRRRFGGSENGVGRITHYLQSAQARETAEGPSRDARELVVVLLRDGEDERSEAFVVVA